ncbi:regulator [Bacillus canaveralius]|uniref:Regulator n=1 Tax=Bacillus canaveralius TaxID=1403243 RepID=A0A2N5GNR7_9BACI|nr:MULTISPECIES: YlbF family regulator [Bacillus]PLR84089.1 regulator [Bacillus canaveralius]PLR87322.1 regulator [Bacillus sp. V33-4]PLR96265.1 regulator [Bacillus canaveralius]RSK53550.1 YlbF family regulator [Bacillus canaveralius]
MLATTERIMLLDMADELANMIIESEAAEHYRQCLYKLRNSRETQRKLQAFTKMKEMYEEVQRFGKYHPDYKMVMGEIRTVKRELDLDSNIYEFKKAENELQALLDAVSGLIGKSVSESVKVPTGNPFFDSGSSCGGGCGSGGSCGCSA